MVIGFENSLRVTLIHVKYCQWALFFHPSPAIRMFLKRKWVKAILPEIHFYGRSGVFTTTIHLNFYQVMSLHVYIFHFTTPPTQWMIKVASARGSRGCRTIVRYIYAIVTPPYIWSIAHPSGGQGVCFAKLVLWPTLVNLVMRLCCKWKLQIQMDDHLLLDRGK